MLNLIEPVGFSNYSGSTMFSTLPSNYQQPVASNMESEVRGFGSDCQPQQDHLIVSHIQSEKMDHRLSTTWCLKFNHLIVSNMVP